MEDPALALRNLLKGKWDPDVALDERISENAMAFDTAKMNKDFRYPSIYLTMLTDTYTILDMKTSALRRHYRVDGFLLMNIRIRPKTTASTDFGQWKGLLWNLEEEVVRILRRWSDDAEDIAFLWNFRFVNRDELDVSPAILRREATVGFRFYKVD